MSPAVLQGVVLAAGLSTRMGVLKPLLPLDGTPAVLRSVRSFLEIGVTPIVVLGHEADEIAGALRGVAGVRCVVNEEYRTGMWSSVLCGLRAALDECSSPERWVAVLPADCALVRAETVGRIAREAPLEDVQVVYPIMGGERGHPPLLRCSFAREALTAAPKEGLREVLAVSGVRAVEISVDDEGVLLDMDTPHQYRRMSELALYEALPDDEQCARLQERCEVPLAVRSHCAAVACVATALAEEINRYGMYLNVGLLRAAALLHDVSRTKRNHAVAGAQLLSRVGYARLAPLVAEHMELAHSPSSLLSETEVLYLADKLVEDDRVVGLERRFGESLRRFSANASAREALRRRLAAASFIARRVEELSGRRVGDIAKGATCDVN